MNGKLQELRPDSGRHLPPRIILGLTQGVSSALGMSLSVGGGTVTASRTATTAGRVKAQQRIKVLRDAERNLTVFLNQALAGASDYPVLNAILGTAIGPLGTGAGLIFTIATTALSSAKTSNRVFARDGDEIWRVEELGLSRNGSKHEPTYVLAYFLVDPYRKQSPTNKGWLLHEDRYQLTV